MRDPANAPLLEPVVKQYPDVIDVVKYVAGSADNNQEIAQNVLVKYGRCDTLIPNAGTSSGPSEVVCSEDYAIV